MCQFLPPAPGGSSSDYNLFTPRVTEYVSTVFLPKVGSIGPRNEREMRTLAQALDAILRDDVLLAADTLMQRLKAVEISLHDQHWGVAQHLELVPGTTITAVPEDERRAAGREEERAARVARLATREPSRREARGRYSRVD